MLLAPKQVSWFWRDWSAVCRLKEWSREQAEIERKAYLETLGFSSLTEVDRLDGFDCVMAGLAAVLYPDDLKRQMRFSTMKRTRIYFAIRKLAHEISPAEVKSYAFESPYADSVMRDRFGHNDPDRLSLEELEQLRYTLAARLYDKRHEAREEAEVPLDMQPF